MNRHFLTAALVLLISRVAGAQPAPAEPTPAPEPAEAQPPPADGAPVDATPPVEATPPAVVEEPKQDDKPAVTAKYDGGLKFSTADDQFELKLSFRNQVRFESNRSLDEETPDRQNQFLNSIYIVRARFQVEGHLFGKDNRYKLELGMGDTGSFSFVKDLFMEKRIPDSPVYVRFGQWKRPFNRAELVSDFASTFNERSIANELAGGGRSLGVAVHNDYEKSPEGLEWTVGMFNTFSGGSDRPAITTTCTSAMTGAISCANSRPSTAPLDWGPTVIARVGFNSPKMKGYSESDLEGGPLRYAVGAAYKVDLANLNKGSQPSWAENSSHGVEVDGMVKAMGYSLHAGFVLMKIKSGDPEFGFLLQPGMFVVPKKAEIAARFALITVPAVNAMMEAIHRNQIEARAAFNYYWHGHTWKLANDVGFLKLTGDEPSSDGGDFQLRMMLQLQI
jgi:phosphate-selective porin OprO and OprP